MFKRCSRLVLFAGLVLAAGLFPTKSALAQYFVGYGGGVGFYPSGAYRSFYPTGYYPGYNPYGYVAPIGFPTYSTYYSVGYRGYGSSYYYSPYVYTTNYFPTAGYSPYVYRAGYVCPYGFPCW